MDPDGIDRQTTRPGVTPITSVPPLRARLLSPSDAKYKVYIEDIPGKGRGVVASENIKAGACVLYEQPLILTLISHNDAELPLVFRMFQELSPSDQERYLILAQREESKEDRNATQQQTGVPWAQLFEMEHEVLRVFWTNCFAVGDGSAILYRGSMFNHSCMPNVEWTWNSSAQAMEFYAITGIAKGEELCISYMHQLWRPKADRQRQLSDIWGFRCECPACSDTQAGRNHERKRAHLHKLTNQTQYPKHLETEKQRTDAAKVWGEIAQALKEENLSNATYSMTCQALAIHYQRRNDVQIT